jgi:hypothetical protein
VLFSNGPNKALLVPDSCGETERNGNSIRANVTEVFKKYVRIWRLNHPVSKSDIELVNYNGTK